MSGHEIPQGDHDPSASVVTPEREALLKNVEEYINHRMAGIEELAVRIGGPEASVENVFPKPPKVRAEAPTPAWASDPDIVAEVREKTREYGYGSKTDVTSGLPKVIVRHEAGKVTKMEAEGRVSEKEDAVGYLWEGSNRALGDDEYAHIERIVRRPRQDAEGSVSAAEAEGTINGMMEDIRRTVVTEYDGAVWLAQRSCTEVYSEPVVLPFGYEIAKGNRTLQEPTQQLIEVGRKDGEPVWVLRIDPAEDREARLRGDKKLRFVAESVGSMRPDAPIVEVTSNHYPSREVSVIAAGLKDGRRFGLAMYGLDTWFEVTGVRKEDASLNQVPGDLRVTYDESIALKAEIEGELSGKGKNFDQ